MMSKTHEDAFNRCMEEVARGSLSKRSMYSNRLGADMMTNIVLRLLSRTTRKTQETKTLFHKYGHIIVQFITLDKYCNANVKTR